MPRGKPPVIADALLDQLDTRNDPPLEGSG